MAGMTVDGMVSGLSTSSLVDQLVNAEAVQQTALKTRLSATEKAATAYRSINTKFDALRTAAETMTKAATWSVAKATASSTSVTTTVGTAPQPGSLTFS